MKDDKTNDFTFMQLTNFHAYENVRLGGRYNMFSPQSREATGLSREDYLFVMKNYEKLKAASGIDETL